MFKELLAQLRVHEGRRLQVYHCTGGKLTIGYGRNIEDNGISEKEADLLLYNDVINCVQEANRSFDFYSRLNDPRKAVIINMLFNLGLSRLRGFKKFLAAVAAGDYKTAAAEMLDSRWAKQVKGRAIQLANQMEKGEWQ
ncbi:MAG: glycoside hydrolase family protein [Cellvibrionales bacterium]|nr:glycoside hydrolase family protein [Cellvibrionales bacterium]